MTSDNLSRMNGQTVTLQFGRLRRAAMLLPAVAVVSYFEFALVVACFRGSYLYAAIPAAITFGLASLVLLSFVPSVLLPPRIVLNTNGIHWERLRKIAVSFPWSAIQTTAITYREYEVRSRSTRGAGVDYTQPEKSFDKYALEIYLSEPPPISSPSAREKLRRWEVLDSDPAYGQAAHHYRISIPGGQSGARRCHDAIERLRPQSFVGVSRRSWRYYREPY